MSKWEYEWSCETELSELFRELMLESIVEHDSEKGLKFLEKTIKESLIDLELERDSENEYELNMHYSINSVLVEKICEEFCDFLMDNGFLNKSFNKVNILVALFIAYKQGAYDK